MKKTRLSIVIRCLIFGAICAHFDLAHATVYAEKPSRIVDLAQCTDHDAVLLKRPLPPVIGQGRFGSCYAMSINTGVSYLNQKLHPQETYETLHFSTLDTIFQSTGPDDKIIVKGRDTTVSAFHLRKQGRLATISKSKHAYNDFFEEYGVTSAGNHFQTLYEDAHGVEECRAREMVRESMENWGPLVIDTTRVLAALKKETVSEGLLELFKEEPEAQDGLPPFNIYAENPASEAEFLDTVKKYLKNDAPVLVGFKHPGQETGGHEISLSGYKKICCPRNPNDGDGSFAMEFPGTPDPSNAQNTCHDLVRIQDSNLADNADTDDGWVLAKPLIAKALDGAHTLTAFETCKGASCKSFIMGKTGVLKTVLTKDVDAVKEFLATLGDTEADRALLNNNSDGLTAMEAAVSSNSLAMVRLLMNHPMIDVNKKSKLFGNSPLLRATLDGFNGIAEELLAHDDIDPNTLSLKGVSPLFTSIFKENENLARLLLSHRKIDPNQTVAKGKDGSVSILHYRSEEFFSASDSPKFQGKKGLFLELISHPRFDAKFHAEDPTELVLLQNIHKSALKGQKFKGEKGETDSHFSKWCEYVAAKKNPKAPRAPSLMVRPGLESLLPLVQDIQSIKGHTVVQAGDDIIHRGIKVRLLVKENGERIWVSHKPNISGGTEAAKLTLFYDPQSGVSEAVVEGRKDGLTYVIRDGKLVKVGSFKGGKWTKFPIVPDTPLERDALKKKLNNWNFETRYIAGEYLNTLEKAEAKKEQDGRAKKLVEDFDLNADL